MADQDAQDAVEREYKFDVDPGFRRPDLGRAGRVETLPARRQVTTYLDTPARDLWSRRITLRFRVVPDRPGDAGEWTVKLPDMAGGTDMAGGAGGGDMAGGGAGGPVPAERREVTWPGRPEPVPSEPVPSEAVPPEVRALLRVEAGLAPDARLETVAVLDASRTRLLLYAGGDVGARREVGAGGEPDRPWAELDDDTVEVTAGPRAGLRFRQIELELLGEAGPATAVVLTALRAAGAVPSRRSKFALATGW